MDLKKLYEKTNGGLGQDHFSFTQLSKTKLYLIMSTIFIKKKATIKEMIRLKRW